MNEVAVQAAPPGPPAHSFDWRKNALLFALTVASVFYTGSQLVRTEANPDPSILSGWTFAVPLMVILLCHEFGHWIAARLHGVPASLPYFIPAPVIFLLGTMGAVITMPERIRSRNALLDIGAAGPLAGIVASLPIMVIGLRLSEVHPQSLGHYDQEGQSILYWAIKRLVHGPMPEGHDVFLHPTAFAAWAGFLITVINLVPWGQLDGGHIAYALLGEKHHQVARWVRRSLLLLFGYNIFKFVVPVLLGQSDMPLSLAISNTPFWLLWFGVTGLLGRLGGYEHPPCDPGELSPRRRGIAVFSLVLFVLLFMPTPYAVH